MWLHHCKRCMNKMCLVKGQSKVRPRCCTVIKMGRESEEYWSDEHLTHYHINDQHIILNFTLTYYLSIK